MSARRFLAPYVRAIAQLDNSNTHEKDSVNNQATGSVNQGNTSTEAKIKEPLQQKRIKDSLCLKIKK